MEGASEKSLGEIEAEMRRRGGGWQGGGRQESTRAREPEQG